MLGIFDITTESAELKAYDIIAVGSQLAQYILDFSVVIATVALVWSGVKIITSGGNEEQVTSAKNTLKWAVVGLVIAVMAKLIVLWACQTLDVAQHCKFK